jgi:pimeloyl-ACP methyl ester carboxylesterase
MKLASALAAPILAGLVLAAFAAHAQSPALDPKAVDIVTFKRSDGSEGHYKRWQRAGAKPRTITVFLAGSGCLALGGSEQVWLPFVSRLSSDEVVFLEKPGIRPDNSCDLDRLRATTEDIRWAEADRVMDMIATDAAPGHVFDIVTSSAGNLTACALGSKRQDVRRVALLGAGGGIKFREELEILSQRDPMPDWMMRQAREGVPEFRKQLVTDVERILAQPRPGRNWMGRENSELWWASALDRSCLPYVAGMKADLLVVHGDQDDSVPLVSAEKLVEAAKTRAAGKTELWVVPGGHDMGFLSGDPNHMHERVSAWLSRP